MTRQARSITPRRLVRVLVAGALAAATAAALLVPAGGSARSETAPRNVAEPVVSGSPVQGQTLTTSNGTWTGTAPITFRYRWLRCDASGGGVEGVNCATIVGETRKTYVLVSADVGHRIRSRVVATNADGTASANSNPTEIVRASTAAGNPRNVNPPTISGAPVQNNTLKADPGSWNGSKPISFAFQWRRCDQSGGGCTSIAGATQQTYTIKATDVGTTLRVRATATNSRGQASATSVPTAVVTKAAVPAGTAISVNEVTLPNRLIVDRVSYRPSVLRSRHRIIARYRVSDSHNHPVVGALVFVVGIPFGSVSTPPEAATGPDGVVTFALHPTRRTLAQRSGIVFFVRARKPGELLLGGVSTRRLTFLPGR
jgi:hypothetical protein